MFFQSLLQALWHRLCLTTFAETFCLGSLHIPLVLMAHSQSDGLIQTVTTDKSWWLQQTQGIGDLDMSSAELEMCTDCWLFLLVWLYFKFDF